MGLIRTYTFLDGINFRYLFQTLVRPQYAEAVWPRSLKRTYTQLKRYNKSYEADSFPEKYGLHKPTKNTKNANITIQKVKGRYNNNNNEDLI